ncbi:hypothetical protein KR084_002774 [Drosophila pseudotakahashii]|nr:hypothetical protein KR084_002774 [Drosophila pseudotakahashii]
MKKRGNNRGKSGPGVLELHQVKRVDLAEKSVVIKSPKYLPNLHNLVMPQICYEHSNRIVAARLSMEIHQHNSAAALFFEGCEAPCLTIPRSLFPSRAPLDKIIFMPKMLLPVGFEAGGVFGPGVISRRFYPVGLMPANHKGPTPPLFVGLRILDFQMPPEVKLLLASVPAALTTVLPSVVPTALPPPPPKPEVLIGYTANYMPISTKDRSAEVNALEQSMSRHDLTLSMVYTPPAPPKPPSPYPLRIMPVQYNIYTPDLTNVVMHAPLKCKLTMAILSTVIHPHVPAVALATMNDEECPTFELPSDIFPKLEGVKRPIFLPKRFLPRGFEACCVFKPGSLPELLFLGSIGKDGTPQPQHSNAITPPLFVGKFLDVEDPEEPDRMMKGDEEGSATSIEFNTTKITRRPAHLPKGFLVLETEDPETPLGASDLLDYDDAYNEGSFVRVMRYEGGESQESQETVEPILTPDLATLKQLYFTVFKDDCGCYGAVSLKEPTELADGKPANQKEANKPLAVTDYTLPKNPDQLDDEIVAELRAQLEAKLLQENFEAKLAAEPEPEQKPEQEPKQEPKPDVEEVAGTSKGSQGAKKKYLKHFKIDSDIDLIAHAVAGMGKSEMEMMFEDTLPEMNIDRALDQLQHVLEERNLIRMATALEFEHHIDRMEKMRNLALRKTTQQCSECGKLH